MSLHPFSFNIQQFTQLPSEACIFVGKASSGQMHCGIVYNDPEASNFNTLHLAFHYDLRNEHVYEKWLSKYRCVYPKIHKIRLEIVPEMCNRIIRRKESYHIPYGLLFAGGTRIDDNGYIKIGDNESGLTCATFVMAVFESCRINLIDIKTWEPRRSDIKWHNKIIKDLIDNKIKYGISDDHIENVKKEKGCARYRPEEVAISSFYKYCPEKSWIIRLYGMFLYISLILKNLKSFKF